MDKKGRRFADEKQKPEKTKFKHQDNFDADITENNEVTDDLAQYSEAKAEEHLKKEKDSSKAKDKRLKEKNDKKLEKLMKKNKKEKSNVYAPDEEPIESYSKSEKKSKKHGHIVRRVTAALVIVALLFVVVLFAVAPDRFSVYSISNFINYGILNQNSEESFPVDIQGESVTAGNFERMGQDICYASDTGTKILNNYGRVVCSSQHAFINPILAADSKKALVYNLGNKGYQIMDKEGKTYTSETEDDIITADIVDNGTYALVTRSSGYLSKLHVFDSDHEKIYAYSFADFYVTSVTLNSTGLQAVVSGVSVLDGINISALYVLDFTKDSPASFNELDDNVIYEVDYLSDRYACAVGKNASYIINAGSGELQTYSYEGKSLTAFDINVDTDTYTLCLSGSDDGRNCSVVSVNSSGKEENSFDFEDKVTDLSTYKGRVALLSGDTVQLFSKSGSKVSQSELSLDTKVVVLYTGSDVYTLGTGQIATLSL